MRRVLLFFFLCLSAAAFSLRELVRPGGHNFADPLWLIELQVVAIVAFPLLVRVLRCHRERLLVWVLFIGAVLSGGVQLLRHFAVELGPQFQVAQLVLAVLLTMMSGRLVLELKDEAETEHG